MQGSIESASCILDRTYHFSFSAPRKGAPYPHQRGERQRYAKPEAWRQPTGWQWRRADSATRCAAAWSCAAAPSPGRGCPPSACGSLCCKRSGEGVLRPAVKCCNPFVDGEQKLWALSRKLNLSIAQLDSQGQLPFHGTLWGWVSIKCKPPICFPVAAGKKRHTSKFNV